MTADDLILEINNKSVANQEDYARVTRDLKSGDDVVIKVLRKERGPLRRSWIISFTMPDDLLFSISICLFSICCGASAV